MNDLVMLAFSGTSAVYQPRYPIGYIDADLNMHHTSLLLIAFGLGKYRQPLSRVSRLKTEAGRNGVKKRSMDGA
jgi:hypothetical protein